MIKKPIWWKKEVWWALCEESIGAFITNPDDFWMVDIGHSDTPFLTKESNDFFEEIMQKRI